MTQQTIEAIFENGVFRPLKPVEAIIQEGQHVQLVVNAPASAEDFLALAMNVYAGLSAEEIDEIERIML